MCKEKLSTEIFEEEVEELIAPEEDSDKESDSDDDDEEDEDKD